MIEISNVATYGWQAAIRGMRNPLNSWDKSDSHTIVKDGRIYEQEYTIGDNDWKLMHTLIASGTDHSKFMRMIGVSLDINAPLYWWKEFDTYKVGTVANSCSTMHKIQAKEFSKDDFSIEHLQGDCLVAMDNVIHMLNVHRQNYNFLKDKKYWWQMIQLLPASYNQKRTVTLNYQVLRNIYFARKNHKLDEWHIFCNWIMSLPYHELITTDYRKAEKE